MPIQQTLPSLPQEKLTKLRLLMQQEGLQGLLVPSSDPYLSEYPPAHWQTRAWLTGFHGSAGSVLITLEKAALRTDSRYWIQAEKNLQGTGIDLIKAGAPHAPSTTEWFAQHLPEKSKVGYCPEFFSLQEDRTLQTELGALGLEVSHTRDLVDGIWLDRPSIPKTPVKSRQAGSQNVATKLEALRLEMLKHSVANFVSMTLDDIAWVTNLRGEDIAYNTVFVSRLIVTQQHAWLFINPDRLEQKTIDALRSEGVGIRSPEHFPSALSSLKGLTWIDPQHLNAAVADLIPTELFEQLSPLSLAKSRKTSGEIQTIREAMLQDGIALVEFYADLQRRLDNHERLTELDVVELLLKARQKQPDFIIDSFATIAAFGPHAALPHYTPDPQQNATLTQGLLLIDSGGQYTGGTTDITRMFAVGQLSDEERFDTTMVLKAMIHLAQAIVPAGTSGAQLDVFARAQLWQQGYDFGHGTGHGVGYGLSVHEGPFYISPRAMAGQELGLHEGIVVSDEPGLYKEGQWGIRIENLILATHVFEKNAVDYLGFETLTLCPIDVRTLDPKRLTEEEKDWLNHYHDHVRSQLAPRVSDIARQWLINATAPL